MGLGAGQAPTSSALVLPLSPLVASLCTALGLILAWLSMTWPGFGGISRAWYQELVGEHQSCANRAKQPQIGKKSRSVETSYK